MKPRKKKEDEIQEIPLTPTDEEIAKHMQEIKQEREQLKKVKPPLGEENLMEMGRIIGTITRTHPHVLQIIKEESARTGRKEYEILRDWVINYAILRYDTLHKMSVAELYEAFQILREFLAFAVETFGKFAKIMFSTQMQTFTEIIEEATKQKTGYTPEAKEKLMHKLIDSFTPMMEIFSEMMTKSIAKMMGIQTPKPNIPVNIKYQEENKNE